MAIKIGLIIVLSFCMIYNEIVTDNGVSFREEGPGSWSEVILQAPEIADLNIPLHRDPREVYLERLFQPGRFSMQDIRRALSVCMFYIL